VPLHATAIDEKTFAMISKCRYTSGGDSVMICEDVMRYCLKTKVEKLRVADMFGKYTPLFDSLNTRLKQPIKGTWPQDIVSASPTSPPLLYFPHQPHQTTTSIWPPPAIKVLRTYPMKQSLLLIFLSFPRERRRIHNQSSPLQERQQR